MQKGMNKRKKESKKNNNNKQEGVSKVKKYGE